MMETMKGLMIRSTVRPNGAAGTPALTWCRTVAVSQSSLRNTARPRRSPAHAGAGVGLYDPRSAHGRPLTAAAGARNRV
jgi:hypothetical protein